MKKYLVFIASFVLLISISKAAKDISESEMKDTLNAYHLDEVKVNAQRMSIPFYQNPSAVSIVGPEIKQEMPRTVAIDEALRLVPGVRIDNQANGSRVHLSIRGQGILSEHGIRGIQIMVDGIPLNDPTGFAPDLYNIDWETVKSIEVLRGPNASLYGGGASGGIINITTDDGAGEKPLSVKLLESGGSNGFWKSFVQASGSGENTSYRISASRMMGNGYREHSAFWGNNISEKITWEPSEKLSLTQTAGYVDYWNQNAEGLNLEQYRKDPRLPNDDAIPMDEYQQTGRFYGGFSGDYRITDNHSIALSAYMKKTSYKEPGSKYIWHREFVTPGGSLQYNYKLMSGNWENIFSAGVDVSSQDIGEYIVKNMGRAKEDSTLQSNQEIKQGLFSVFAIDRIEFNKKWGFMLSARYDKITNELKDLKLDNIDLSGSKNFDKATMRLGLTYNPSKACNLFASWGQGFLPPATEELSSNPANPGGFNQSLEPSLSQGFEIGSRGLALSNLYYELTAFYTTTEKDFDRYRILPERPLETFYRNLGESRRFGIESAVDYTPFDWLKIQAAYTFSNFKYTSPDSINGNYLPNSPVHQLSFDIAYNPVNRLTIAFGWDIQSEWYIFANRSDITQDGFRLFNARIIYTLELMGYQADLGIYGKNLFDQKWVAFTEPDPDGNSYQPGPGRELFGSVRIKL